MGFISSDTACVVCEWLEFGHGEAEVVLRGPIRLTLEQQREVTEVEGVRSAIVIVDLSVRCELEVMYVITSLMHYGPWKKTTLLPIVNDPAACRI